MTQTQTHTWHVKPNTPFCSNRGVERFQHTRAFMGSASPRALVTGCVRQTTDSVPSQQRLPATYTPQGPNPVSLFFMDGAHQAETDSREWIGSETVGGVFVFFNVAVCVFWCGTVCLSLCLCLCVWVSVQLCNQPLCWQCQSKHKHHWFFNHVIIRQDTQEVNLMMILQIWPVWVINT